MHRDVAPTRPIVLIERGDTVTENALMAAALHPGTTVIRNASSNYMVQDLCFFLQELGVGVDGIGTTTLADGTSPKGFIVETEGIVGAKDVSEFGGWRAYIASLR